MLRRNQKIWWPPRFKYQFLGFLRQSQSAIPAEFDDDTIDVSLAQINCQFGVALGLGRVCSQLVLQFSAVFQPFF